MGPDPRILDDLARVAGGAVNIFSGLQQQIRDDIKTRLEDMAVRMDLVPREDLDRAIAMINALRKRVDDLETQVAGKKPAAKPTAKSKPKAKKKK